MYVDKALQALMLVLLAFVLKIADCASVINELKVLTSETVVNEWSNCGNVQMLCC